MIRPIVFAAAVVVLALPQIATAQVCRRVCRKGEVRDANRCCVSARVRVRRWGRGTLRLEADVGRARVKVAGKWHRVTLPALLTGIAQGKHVVVIKAGKNKWRGVTRIHRGQTTRLFASVAGGEWVSRSGDDKRARAILDAALKAKGGAAVVRALPAITYYGVSSPHVTIHKGATHSMFWINPARRNWTITTGRSTKRLTLSEVVSATSRWSSRQKAGKKTQKTAPSGARERDMLWRFPDAILARHKDALTKVALLPTSSIQGALMDVVQIARRDGSGRTRLFIDRATRMVRRIQGIDGAGAFLSATELERYRSVSGVAFAFRWTYEGKQVDWSNITVSPVFGKKRPIAKAPVRSSSNEVRTLRQLTWRDSYPKLTHFNRDGIQDFFGLCWSLLSEYLPNGKLTNVKKYWICGVDGRTFKELWRMGPLNRQAQVFAMANRRVMVVDRPTHHRSAVSIYELKGRRRVFHKVIDGRFSQVCVGPKRRQVSLRFGRGNHMVVDSQTGALHKSVGPAWCQRLYRSGCRRRMKYRARCLSRKDGHALVPRVSGFNRSYMMVTKQGLRMAFGIERRGGVRPVVVAYDRSNNVLWRRPVIVDSRRSIAPRYADVSGGTLILAYDLRYSAKVVAMSARTGKQLWTTTLPFRSVRNLHLSARRVYVADFRYRELAVMSLRTGKLIGTFGTKKPTTTIRQALPHER